jgi:hypothetical protein
VRTILLAVAFAIALAESAVADSVARGLGADTCAHFAEYYRADPEFADMAYITWAQGFMSGWNYATMMDSKNVYRDLGDEKSLQTQAMHIRQFCNNHPLATFVEAVMDLYVSLPLKKNIRTQTERPP